jgi:hypothetical protein
LVATTMTNQGMEKTMSPEEASIQFQLLLLKNGAQIRGGTTDRVLRTYERRRDADSRPSDQASGGDRRTAA